MKFVKDIDKYNRILEIFEEMNIVPNKDNPNGDYPYNFYLYAKNDDSYIWYNIDKIYKRFTDEGFKCSYYYDEDGDHLFEVYYHKIDLRNIKNEINLNIQKIEEKYGVNINYTAEICPKKRICF